MSIALAGIALAISSSEQAPHELCLRGEYEIVGGLAERDPMGALGNAPLAGVFPTTVGGAASPCPLDKPTHISGVILPIAVMLVGAGAEPDEDVGRGDGGLVRSASLLCVRHPRRRSRRAQGSLGCIAPASSRSPAVVRDSA
jgi:hypothetical protein